MPFRPDQTAPSTPGPGSDDEGIILLTEVLEEPHSEVVLEISPAEGLDALKQPRMQPPGPAEAPEESLDEFLASLKGLPGESAAALETDPLWSPEDALLDVQALREAVRRELSLMLQEGELQTLVREAVREATESLCRELFPQVAREVIGREIEALKKCLAGMPD